MNKVDRFFDDEIKAIAVEGRAIARKVAKKLQEDILAQIERNFRNPSAAFLRGVKTYEFDRGSYVRLSPILSAHAEPNKIQGNPNLWILLPDGARLGFRRIGREFNWSTLKRRYGNRLSFIRVGDGHVVLYRTPKGQVKPIYKIQTSVENKQRIEFFETAEKILEGLDG